MFCCTLLYVHSSIAIILMGKRELIALLNLSSWCLVMVERLFLAVPRGCLQFVIVVFPDHTHLLFFIINNSVFILANNADPDEIPHFVIWQTTQSPMRFRVLWHLICVYAVCICSNFECIRRTVNFRLATSLKHSGKRCERA